MTFDEEAELKRQQQNCHEEILREAKIQQD